jgi:hypothetical protein
LPLTLKTKQPDVLEVSTLQTVTLLAYSARQTVLTEAALVLEDIILLTKTQVIISSLVAPSWVQPQQDRLKVAQPAIRNILEFCNQWQEPYL